MSDMEATKSKLHELMKTMGVTPKEAISTYMSDASNYLPKEPDAEAPGVVGIDEAHDELCIHTKNGEPCAHCDPPPPPKEQHANAGTVDFQCTGLPGKPCSVGPRNKPMKLSGSPNQVAAFLAWFEANGIRCTCGGEFHSLKIKEREEKKIAARKAEFTAKQSSNDRTAASSSSDFDDELSLPPIESLAPEQEEVTEDEPRQDNTDASKPVEYDW